MKLTRIFVAVVILTTSLGCQSGTTPAIPDDLLGVWKTSAPKYADRYFEITKDAIAFGTGAGNAASHRISNIQKVSADKSIFYTISYANHDGQHYTFSFYYEPANDGVIRLKNQKHITWTKERR